MVCDMGGFILGLLQQDGHPNGLTRADRIIDNYRCSEASAEGSEASAEGSEASAEGSEASAEGSEASAEGSKAFADRILQKPLVFVGFSVLR